MPWRMPSSLRRFRSLTMGRPMIMGRKTFAAIGRPLDGRDTIVLTRDQHFDRAGVYKAFSLAEALALASQLAATRGTDEIVVAGGGEIYAEALPFASVVHLDLIDAQPEGDTIFPALDMDQWREDGRNPIPPLAGDEFPATALLYRRIGPAEAMAKA